MTIIGKEHSNQGSDIISQANTLKQRVLADEFSQLIRSSSAEIGVRAPGATQLARIFRLAYSKAMYRVMTSMAPFAAA